MTRSWFGGDPNLAHFNVRLPFQSNLPHDLNKRLEIRAERSRQEAELKGQGIKLSTIFSFRTDDPKGKARAKAAAEGHAKAIQNQTGIEMAVYEGCFL